MDWLSKGDPVKLKAFNELPVVEYFILLDKRIAEYYSELKAIQSANSKIKNRKRK